MTEKIMFGNKEKYFGKEYDNLLKAGLQGGKWIDAGSGYGAYTFPLSQLVEQVLAIDKNESNIKRLEEIIKVNGITNIQTRLGDLTNVENYTDDIQGVLFAFSLHYHNNIEILAKLVENKGTKTNFKIVIIDYTRTTPVPWVPKPCPPEKVLQKLSESLKTINVIFRNNRYYILVIK